MAGDDVVVTYDSEVSGAVRDLLKIASAQKQVEAETLRAARAAEKQAHETARASEKQNRNADALNKSRRETSLLNTGVAGLTSSFGKLASIIGTAGVGSALVQMMNGIQEGRRSLVALQKEVFATEQSLSLGAVNLGHSGEAQRKAIMYGAGFGVDAKGSMGNVQVFQSRAGGDYRQGLLDAKQAFLLSKAGAPIDAARDAILAGMDKGMTAPEAAASLAKAADLSMRGVSELSQAAASGALVPFDDPQEAFAAITALSGSIAPGELGTYTRATARAFSGGSAFSEYLSEHAKKQGFDYAGATTGQRLNFAAGLGLDTRAEGLRAMGVNEEREVTSLAVLFDNLEAFNTALVQQKEAAANPQYTEQLVERLMTEKDKEAFEARRDVAMTQMESLTGFEGSVAMKRDAAERQLAQMALAGEDPLLGGFGRGLADPRTGELNAFGRGWYNISAERQTDKLLERDFRNPSNDATNTGLGLAELTEALRENTEATLANSNAARSESSEVARVRTPVRNSGQ